MQDPTVNLAGTATQNDRDFTDLADLQDLLQIGLSWFLNGEKITPYSRLLYPFVDHLITLDWRQWAADVQQLIRVLESDTMPLQLESVTPSRIADFLARSYQRLMESSSVTTVPSSLNVQKQIQLRPFDEQHYQTHKPSLTPIIRLADYVNRYLTELTYGVYLHGSMSTLDYVAGSSDVDALVIVNQTTLTSARRLMTLRRRLIYTLRWFYAIDPFQHHGYFILTEFDLTNFDDALFPSSVLNSATTLSGHQKIRLCYRSVCRDVTIPFRNQVEMFRRSVTEKRPLRNWFEMKLYLQSMLLLPTLYLQALGKPVYKGDSFPLVKRQMPESIWAIVQKGTDIRSLGREKRAMASLLEKALTHLPSPWALEIVYRRLVKQMPQKASQILGDDWRQEILDLANYLADDLARKGAEI